MKNADICGSSNDSFVGDAYSHYRKEFRSTSARRVDIKKKLKNRKVQKDDTPKLVFLGDLDSC